MLLLLLFGVCAVAFSASAEKPLFVKGRQFIYDYDGQGAVGLETSQQTSIAKMKSTLLFTMIDETTAQLQATNSRYGTLNEEMTDVDRVKPFEIFEEITNKHKVPKLKNGDALEMPFQFEYNNGVVGRILFNKKETDLSKNWKRSVASLFQVKMPEIREKDRTWIENVMEMGIEGECDTMYTVRRNGPSLNVTKAIDFSNCTTTPILLYGYRFINTCDKCAPKQLVEGMKPYMQGVLRSTVSNVVLNVDSNDYFSIDKSETVSHYMNRRAEIEGSNSVAVSSIKLKEVQDVDRIARIANPAPSTSIMYEAEFELLEEKFLMYGDVYAGNRKDLWAKAEKYLKALADTVHKKDSFTSKESHNFYSLLLYLEKMSMKDLEMLFEKVSNRPNQLQFFIEALSSAASLNSMSFLVDKTVKKEIDESMTAHSLATFMIAKVVAHPMIKKLQSLCENPTVESKMLKQSCWLTFGSLVNGICKPNTDKWAVRGDSEEEEKLCSREHKMGYLDTMVKNFKNAHSRYEKILALQTFGNAGLDTSVLFVESIIKNKREDKLVRMQAIEALHQLRYQMPRRIQGLLLPVFVDILVPVEVRMAAFSMIMRTVPDRAVVDQLVNVIVKEQNEDLGAFVISELNALTNSKNPCEKQLADHLASIVKLPRLNVFEAPLLDKYVNLPIYSYGKNSGLSIDLGSFAKATDVIPTSLVADVNYYVMDKFSSLITTGIYHQHAEHFVQQLIELFGNLLKSEAFQQQFGKVLADTDPSKMTEDGLKELVKNLTLTSKDITKDMSMFGYHRAYDLNYAFILLDQETITEILDMFSESGMKKLFSYWSRSHRFNYFYAGLGQNMEAKIPTSIGLPLIVRDYESKVGTIQGTVGPYRLGWDLTISMPIQMHATASVNKMFSAHMWGGFYMYGVEHEQNRNGLVPVDGVVGIGMEVLGSDKWKMFANITAPREEFRLIGVHSHPVVIRRLHGEPTRKGDYVTVRESTEERESPVAEEMIAGDWLGVDVLTRTHGSVVAGIPTYMAHTESGWELMVKPNKNSPKQYIAHLHISSESPQMETMNGPNMETFYEDEEIRQFFKTEDDEMERRRVNEHTDNVRSYFSDVKFRSNYGFDIETVGARVDHKVSSLLTTICDDKRHCKAKLDVNRAPIHSRSVEKPWKMLIEMETFAPEKINSLEEIKKSRKEHLQWIAEMRALWGAENKQMWNMKVQAEESESKIKTIKKISDSFIQKLSAQERRTLLEEAGVIDAVKMYAQYNLTEENKLWLHDILNNVRSSYYWNTYSKYTTPSKWTDGRAFFTIDLDSRSRQFANVTVETPIEKVLFYEIKLPVMVPKWNPLMASAPSTIMSAITDPLKSATCSVNKNRMFGFDKQQYIVPFTRCYAVLSVVETGKDKFAVLTGNRFKDGLEKKLQVLTGDMRMDAELGGEMIIRINKHLVSDSQTLASYGIILREHVLTFENSLVKVTFDGRRVDIALSKLHLKRQTGLCAGLSPLESENVEMEHKIESIMQLHERFTYAPDDDQCSIDLMTMRDADKYESVVEDEFEVIEFKEIEPVDVTDVIERRHDVCFSLRPVRKCPRESTPEKRVPTAVAYGCKPRSHETRKLIYKARHGVVEVADYTEIHEMTDMVTRCILNDY